MPETSNHRSGHRRHRYPHLLPPDVPVWERFLDIYGPNYTHFDYDIRVGFGLGPDPAHPANIQKMTDDLTRRRIDALGHTPERLDIIEVTKLAGIKAIGQLVTYPILYRVTFSPSVIIRPVLVCEALRPDMEIVLDALSITYYIS